MHWNRIDIKVRSIALLTMSRGIYHSIPTYTITNYNWPLQAVHCYTDSALDTIWWLNVLVESQIGPHQVTYEVVAWLIQLQRK